MSRNKFNNSNNIEKKRILCQTLKHRNTTTFCTIPRQGHRTIVKLDLNKASRSGHKSFKPKTKGTQKFFSFNLIIYKKIMTVYKGLLRQLSLTTLVSSILLILDSRVFENKRLQGWEKMIMWPKCGTYLEQYGALWIITGNKRVLYLFIIHIHWITDGRTGRREKETLVFLFDVDR